MNLGRAGDCSADFAIDGDENMALDRWIALILAGICLAYGYTAWFTMDANLAPFMQRNPIWPSTFPKALSVLGLAASCIILFNLEKGEDIIGDIDYRRLGDYKIGQAIMLLLLMVAYALCLRPLGFIGSTMSFLVLGAFILGERKWHVMLIVAFIATFAVWYLVSEVLGIYMRPLPRFLGG
jgi:putative tricarboxylic transport membrane protein